MNKQQILDTLVMLSKSQGYYGRMLDNLVENRNLDEFLQILENMDFQDEVDLVIFLESWKKCKFQKLEIVTTDFIQFLDIVPIIGKSNVKEW